MSDETCALYDEESGCEGRHFQSNSAGVDQGQEDQASGADAERSESNPSLERIGFEPASGCESENLLEGPRQAGSKEINGAGICANRKHAPNRVTYLGGHMAGSILHEGKSHSRPVRAALYARVSTINNGQDP